MLAQIFLFPFAAKSLGTLNTFRFVVISWPTLYFLTPYLVLLPQYLQRTGVYCLLLWKTTAHVLAYPSNAILLTNSAPSLLVLGTINGIAASTASLSRAFGPTATGFNHTWGLEIGCTGLAWWASGIICILGSVESLWMKEEGGRMIAPIPGDEGDETASGEALLELLATDAAMIAASDPGGFQGAR